MSLPSHYLITPKVDDESAFLIALEDSLRAGTRLMQLTSKGLDDDTYTALAEKVIAIAHNHGCKVLLDGEPARVVRLGADGLHLDSKAVNGTTERPLPDDYLLAVSGHTLEALQHGEALGADFAVLSPVNYTKAHPDIEPLGWDGFGDICAEVSMPVYALGGVGTADEETARAAGGQGVAGNKGCWKG